MKHRIWSLVGQCVLILTIVSGAACHRTKSNIEQMTPLEEAIEVDISVQKVKMLLDGGSDPNQQSLHGYTPLIKASDELRIPREREHLTNEQVRSADEIVALLLEHRADPNQRTNDGTTALIVAVAANRVGAISLLLNKGASMEVQTVSGDTPLLLAGYLCRPVALKLLIDHGANLGHKNSSGETVFEVVRKRCPQSLSELPQH